MTIYTEPPFLDVERLIPLIPIRDKETHKGSYGHALVIGGELGKIGACLLTAKAFMRAGGGLVSVALPECSYTRIEPTFLEAMYLPLKTETPYLAFACLDALRRASQTRTVTVIGPGLGVFPDTERLVCELVRTIETPMVLDADALTCLAPHLEQIDFRRVPIVFTPHVGEMARLMHVSTAEILADRDQIARTLATRLGVYVVLKGHQSRIAMPTGELYRNPTGNPGMATAGMGDVLSGIIASFIAQGLHVRDAVMLAVFVHGAAGDHVATAQGENGMLASDVIEALPETLIALKKKRS